MKILPIVLIMAFNSLVFCDSIEDGWKGIKTLKTNRKTAEKVLGTPKKITQSGYFNYETDDFFAQVNYSDPPCEKSSYGRGDYNVPGETVLEYNVILYTQVKLSDFKFKREKYERQIDSERNSLIYYDNSEDAILISVGIIDGVEYVGRIRFYPSPADKKKFECKNSEAAIVKTIEESKSIEPLKIASKIKFTSVYTKLDSKTCKPMRKAENEQDEVPLICKGYKGYKMFLGEHGLNPPMYIGREISTDLNAWNRLDFPSYNGAEMGQIIEWRLADGEPFAFIIRAEYDKQDYDTDEKGKVNKLVVQNLRGFAPISVSIDATKNKRANEDARAAADAGYGKP